MEEVTLQEKNVGVIGREEPVVVAVDNGGTTTTVHGMDGAHNITMEYDTPHDYPLAIYKLANAIRAVARQRSVDAVGVAIAGEVAEDGGSIVRAGELTTYGFVNAPYREALAYSLGIEEDQVVLNGDCDSAAIAQQAHNFKIGSDSEGFVETISTGNGGSGFEPGKIKNWEPGHEYLRAGAICGCTKEGCVEAFISGSGIEKRFGRRGENIPADDPAWQEILEDTVDAHIRMVNRFFENGFNPKTLYFFGSVALKSGIIMPGLSAGMAERQDELHYLPNIALATYGKRSGLVGARVAALGRLEENWLKSI
jgi:predicted NBD/HSP70 family sugar kinase